MSPLDIRSLLGGGHSPMFLQVSVAEDRRFELLRGCPQHAFQVRVPSVRDRPLASVIWDDRNQRGLADICEPRTNETANETEAEAGTDLGEPAREILASPDGCRRRVNPVPVPAGENGLWH